MLHLTMRCSTRFPTAERSTSVSTATAACLLGGYLGISLAIACMDQAEVDRLWAALCDGGSPGHCGWLKDRWGLSWQIVPLRLHELLADPYPDRSRRAMEAMLEMTKLDNCSPGTSGRW